MLSAVMKAIVLRELGGPERLVMEQVADPAPGPGDAIVALRAAALNHRDAWIRKGLYAGITLPIILGSDGAGEVAAVGEGVDPSWLGRHVVINPSLDWGPDSRVQGPSYRILGLPDDGTYAGLVKVPAANLHVKPPALSWESSAAIPLAGLTAYRALVTRARVQPGETVLITGIGGGVATMALLIARHLGARVIVTSGSDAKLVRARQLGADGGVNYTTDTWATQARSLCEGGPDVIVDSAGRDAFAALLDVVKPGGRIVTFGATTGSPATIEVRRIFWKQIAILGSTMGTPAEFAEMLALFDGPLVPVVDRVFPLAAVPDAHRRMDQADQFGKIVLEIA
jgi:NADPH:quinone reductase-like Zn-dependent oxidoreductase